MVEEQQAVPEDAAQQAQQQCIFCHIISGNVASKKVYEDDKVVCVLDINPANPGHVLVIPKEHYVIMPQIPEDVLQHIGMIAKGISHAQLRSLQAQGTNIFIANGVVAGQRAQHFMMHVIPRMEGDQVGFAIPERAMSQADAKKVQQILKKAVAKSLGLKTETEQETPEETQTPIKEQPVKQQEEPAKNPAKKEKPQTQKPNKGANLDDIARLLAGGS